MNDDETDYKTWEAGTLLEAKVKLFFLLHSPDPWDFQSTKYETIPVSAGERFVLMFPVAEEVYSTTLYKVVKILHPTHGKLVMGCRCDMPSEETHLQEVLKRIIVEE